MHGLIDGALTDYIALVLPRMSAVFTVLRYCVVRALDRVADLGQAYTMVLRARNERLLRKAIIQSFKLNFLRCPIQSQFCKSYSSKVSIHRSCLVRLDLVEVAAGQHVHFV